MAESGWQKLVAFINGKELNHVFKRDELLLWANLNGIATGSIDGYRNQLVQTGYWKRIKRGTYQLQQKLPVGTTTTEMYHLRQNDRLKYLEKVVARKERVQRQQEKQQLEEACLAVNSKVVTEAISKACLDCKGSFPRVAMTFSYRQPPSRHRMLSRMILGETTKLIAEIQKCDTLCMNCHLIRRAVGSLA